MADIVGLVYLAKNFIDSIVGPVTTGFATLRNQKLIEQYNKLAQSMAKDKALMYKLKDAYDRKDSGLLNAIATASPFSTAIEKLKDARLTAIKGSKQATKQITDIEQKESKLNTDLAEAQNKIASTGSLIGDLVKGGGNLSSTPELKTDYTPLNEQTVDGLKGTILK